MRCARWKRGCWFARPVRRCNWNRAELTKIERGGVHALLFLVSAQKALILSLLSKMQLNQLGCMLHTHSVCLFMVTARKHFYLETILWRECTRAEPSIWRSAPLSRSAAGGKKWKMEKVFVAPAKQISPLHFHIRFFCVLKTPPLAFICTRGDRKILCRIINWHVVIL